MFNLQGPMKRVVTVAGVALLLLGLFSFSNRIAEFTRLTAQEEIESQRIDNLELTQSYLDDQIAYATSEAAVEEWAREEARMAQDGDFPVVPLNPNAEDTAADSQPAGRSEPESKLQVWLDWFFYDGP